MTIYHFRVNPCVGGIHILPNVGYDITESYSNSCTIAAETSTRLCAHFGLQHNGRGHFGVGIRHAQPTLFMDCNIGAVDAAPCL